MQAEESRHPLNLSPLIEMNCFIKSFGRDLKGTPVNLKHSCHPSFHPKRGRKLPWPAFSSLFVALPLPLVPPVSRVAVHGHHRERQTPEKRPDLIANYTWIHTLYPNTPWDWHRTADQLGWCQGGQCRHILAVPWSVWV